MGIPGLPSLRGDGVRDPRIVAAIDAALTIPSFGTDVAATLRWVVDVAATTPHPGEGDTSINSLNDRDRRGLPFGR